MSWTGAEKELTVAQRFVKLTSSKVLGRALLVSAHDRQPAVPVDVVRGDGGLAVLEGLEGAGRGHDDRETGRDTETLLGGRDDNVKAPVVEADLLRGDRAHGVEGNERVGRVLLDELGVVGRGSEDTGRGVDVGDGDELDLLALERSHEVLVRHNTADGRGDLGHLGTVGLEASGLAE